MSVHPEPYELAGQTVTVTPAAPLFGQGNCEPLAFRVEDWQDRVFGRSWMFCDGNPAALSYAMRSAAGRLPTDDDVVYGKDPTGFGHIVHVSEVTSDSPPGGAT